MTIEMLVGLNVTDPAVYQSYRQAIQPYLERYGGGFSYDFRIADVLKSRTAAPINRVFTIYFTDKAALDAFFADPEYQQVKQRYFEQSVADTTIIATYEY
ncbi:MAG: DUF1330 domain-containing protein [Spirulinaceae cyanobacterium RM2_2_10]|nr:DUF1330 domain-containing protein [Spirulinaceae cyanobacterium SM2_1_0]NJO20228.1 DUF1330 domain-containing protein [Spirulinaceae cyanobacterium RM2_2_10]